MKKSWWAFFRRWAAVFVVSSATAWSSALCYAQIASDNAADPAYDDGWQEGDNGGYGFTAWNFDGTYYSTVQQAINSNSPFNQLGTAWTLFNPNGTPQVTDIAEAGRGFAPLQVGQTLEVVFDNPTVRQLFRGYFIRLNGGTGGVDGNLCYGGLYPCTPGGTPIPETMLIRFESEIFNSGEWRVQDAGRDSVGTGVFDTDTAAAGALFSVTRTGTDTYDVLLDPLGEGPSYMASHTFAFAGVPVDWIQFTLNNTVTDTNTPPTKATDFYISSMRIVPEPGTWSLLLLGSAGVLLGMARRRTDEYFDDGEWRVESAT